MVIVKARTTSGTLTILYQGSLVNIYRMLKRQTLTIKAVKNGESEQKMDVLVGAFIPKASVPTSYKN